MKEQQESLIELSSRTRRIVAFSIDHFVMTFIMVATVLIAFGTDFIGNYSVDKMQSIMLWVMIATFLLYFSKDSVKGISVGKWMMGIMIRNDSDNKTPTFTKLFVRNLFIVIWPVEFIVLAMSTDKKRLGDLTVKTKVLKNPNKPMRLPRIGVLILIGACFFLFTTYTVASAMKNSDSYKVAIESIEANERIIETTGGISRYGNIPRGIINITNGYGIAQLQIRVKGNRADLDVYVHLEKEPEGQWILKDIR